MHVSHITDSHIQCRISKPRRFTRMSRDSHRDLNAQACIHRRPPHQISPRIIALVIHPVPLRPRIRIGNPLRLLVPQPFGHYRTPLRLQSDQNEFGPRLHHRLSIRNTPSGLIQARRMHHLMYKNPHGLLLPIDIDTLIATWCRISSIHVLGPNLSSLRKAPLNL